MRVRVKYLGSALRELVGASEEWMELEGQEHTVAGVLAAIARAHGEAFRYVQSSSLLLVNGAMTRDTSRLLSEGDIVEILPLPVGG